MPIVFEKVRFNRATNLPKEGGYRWGEKNYFLTLMEQCCNLVIYIKFFQGLLTLKSPSRKNQDFSKLLREEHLL